MSNPFLFYKDVVPVNKVRHANWAIKASNRFDFVRNIHSVPLTAIEFPNASPEFVIVFAKNSDVGYLPIAVVGVSAGQNLFVSDEGTWNAKYLPAFVRRYPFVFSTDDAGQTLTLCLDEAYEAGSAGGEGERLFTDAGEHSPYLTQVVGFLQEYQNHFQRTQLFCKRLEEWDLLEPMGAKFTAPDGREGSLSGFSIVSREKLKNLAPEKLAELVKTDELEMVYLHLQSLQNISKLVERIKPDTATA